MSQNKETIKRIEELENQLRKLKLELKQENKLYSKSATKNPPLKLGDEVEILNPKKGQESYGTIVNFNKKTDYVTVQTTRGKVVRAQFNVQKRV